MKFTKRRTAVAGVVAVACVTLAAAASSDETTLPAPPEAGRYTLVLDSNGHERVAHLHIPKGYAPASLPPLVLLLHGGGGGGLTALEKNGWAAKADQEGFIVVAPDGLGAAPNLPTNFGLNPAVWNSGQFAADSPRAAIDDVAYFVQLLDELKTKLPYDEKRVFCAGHSNGGGMAFRAAVEMPERLAAVGIVAGLIAVDDPTPKKALPALYILGIKDPLIPIDGGEVATPWGKRVRKPIAEPLAKWAAAIDCQTEPTLVSDAEGVRKMEYASRSSSGSTLTVLYLEGQGHQWPGGTASLPGSVMGPNASQFDATDAIWRFFRSATDSKE